ncbi:MAG: putative DNA binding domain-containing protein [Tannerellaceae bacterium]|jgi:ATP-dependent DNA helicase RecG|nr:putative DNA binding domain-containing protein [Tannerellaceae bacterium]
MLIMDVKELKLIIGRGESPFVEFSKCTTELTDSVFQSICSFLNKSGGCLIVGVHDFGKIVGVAEIFMESMLKKFANVMEHEFSPSFSLVPQIVDMNGRKLFFIDVPQSEQVHRYKNKVYDRAGRDVCDITYSYCLIENLYLRKRNKSSENIVCPFLRMSELDEMAFRTMRKHIAAIRPGHPWLLLSDEELLHMNGFWGKDPISDKEGFVLAAVLLFGKEETIHSYNPVTYRTDAIYRNVSYDRFSQLASDYPESRYDDRDIIFSNLITSYSRLMKFIQRNLPKRVLNQGATSVNVREKLFNEIITNFLVHREYTHKSPCRLLIFSDKVITENGTSAIYDGSTSLNALEVQTRNPLITDVFQAMGWIEERGSGKKNICRYAPFYDKSFEIELNIQEETFAFSITYGNEEGLEDLSLLSAEPQETLPPLRPRPVSMPGKWGRGLLYASRLLIAYPDIEVDISYIDKAESVLEACMKPLPIQDIMRITRQSNRTRFRKNIIRPLLEEGLLAMRIPTKPSSPLQTYFTTERGKELLQMPIE